MEYEHKGYICHFAFNEAEKLFHGKVANSHYMISFQGKSIAQLQRNFKKAVDRHLVWRKNHLKKSEKYSTVF